MVASLVPSVAPFNGDIHLVLCDFGKLGQAFVETDISTSSREDIVRGLVNGQYARPLRVVALNLENWSRDVSEDIAIEVARTAEHEGCNLTEGTRKFLASQLGSEHQPSIRQPAPMSRTTTRHSAGGQDT
jgi:hypothetical protein